MFFPQVQIQSVSCHPLTMNGTIASPFRPALTTATDGPPLPPVRSVLPFSVQVRRCPGLFHLYGHFNGDSPYTFVILYQARLGDLLLCLGSHPGRQNQPIELFFNSSARASGCSRLVFWFEFVANQMNQVHGYHLRSRKKKTPNDCTADVIGFCLLKLTFMIFTTVVCCF